MAPDDAQRTPSGSDDTPSGQRGKPSRGRAKRDGRGRGHGARGERAGHSEDHRRRRSGAESRRQTGFGDDIERVYCQSFRAFTPPDFPVQARSDTATIVPYVVARRPGSILLCDGVHLGPHWWPDGEPADTSAQDLTKANTDT